MNPAIVLSLLALSAPSSDPIVNRVQSALPKMTFVSASGAARGERQTIKFSRPDGVRLYIEVNKYRNGVIPKPGTSRARDFLRNHRSSSPPPSGQEMPSGYPCGLYTVWGLGDGGYLVSMYSETKSVTVSLSAPIHRPTGRPHPERVPLTDFPRSEVVEALCRFLFGRFMNDEYGGTAVSGFRQHTNGVFFESTRLSMKVPIGSNVAFVKGKKVDLGGFAGVSAKGELVLPSAYVKKHLSGKSAR